MAVKKRDWFNISGYSGFLMLVLGILLQVLGPIFSFIGIGSSIVTVINEIGSFFILVFAIFFHYGYVVLGRKYESKLLVIMAYIGVILGIIFILGNGFFFFVDNINIVNAQVISSPMGGETLGNNMNNTAILIVYYLIASVIIGIYSILLGIGLMLLKKKVVFSRSIGILNIIAGASYFIMIGYVAQFAAIILTVVMFFRLSKNNFR